jgi:hypothetical protein
MAFNLFSLQAETRNFHLQHDHHHYISKRIRPTTETVNCGTPSATDALEKESVCSLLLGAAG